MADTCVWRDRHLKYLFYIAPLLDGGTTSVAVIDTYIYQ